MSSEKDMRAVVVKALKPLHAVSVENGCGVGTPDVNFAGGWIELKSIDGLPRDKRIHHFTPAQRLWLRARNEAVVGGAYLLVKVARDWYLFGGSVIEEIYQGISLDAWEGIACWISRGGFDSASFLDFWGLS